MSVHPYVIRYSVRYEDGSGGTSEMQLHAYTAADALTQFGVWLENPGSAPWRTRVERIDPGRLRCPTCNAELNDDESGARNIMFCAGCKQIWVLPMRSST